MTEDQQKESAKRLQDAGLTYLRAQIFKEAEEVFGSKDEAQIWLNTPQRGLDFRKPTDLVTAELGAEHVRAYLSAIRYGNIW